MQISFPSLNDFYKDVTAENNRKWEIKIEFINKFQNKIVTQTDTASPNCLIHPSCTHFLNNRKNAPTL